MPQGKTIVADHAAVASELPLASAIGRDVLLDGGNAFDAAVATSFALAVALHPAGGLGGDFFGMFYEARSGAVRCLNASGWSPSGLTLELLMSKTGGKIPKSGPLACVVPGYVAGVCEMHRELGSTDFRGLLLRPIELADRGFQAGEGLCRSVAGAYQELPPEAREIFAPGGKPTARGEWIRQEALGRVISEIASGGPGAFYSGWPAGTISSTLEAQGVHCAGADFTDFRPEWTSSLSLDYRGTTVHEFPPNSMGATTLLILKLISEGLPSSAGPLSKERVARTMKAATLAYARRDRALGDPRFSRIDTDAFLSGGEEEAQGRGLTREGDTTAFSVVDAEGNVVSGIQSLFQHFGSRVFIPECGIILNNRASGFSTAGPNRVEPRKRPLHTLSSMILERGGRPSLSIGCSGGNYRPLQHALFVTNAVDYGMQVEANVCHPRFVYGGGKTVLIEEGYDAPSGEEYAVQRLPMPGRTGICQAIQIGGGRLKAVCDIRGEGIPAGL